MDKLQNYDIAEKLGEGKHGPTFLGMDSDQQRTVIIKQLDHPTTRAEAWKNNWQTRRQQLEPTGEIQLTRYYSLEESDGRQFIVREFVPGHNLTDWINAGLPSPAQIMAIALALTRQLKSIHDRGLVHGNVTPANVIVNSRGKARLVDDGLGFAGEIWLQHPQAPAREMVCLAPELFKGAPPSFQSDHYALGALLYLMWTGQPAFPDDDPEVLIRSITEEPVSFELHPARELPGVARLLIGKLLAKDPGERFISTDELLFTLRGMITLGTSIEPAPTSAKRPPSPRLYLLVSVLALLLVILWLVITSDNP